MKNIKWLLILLSFNSFANEICDNGIDDDNDGLIDLNDDDCNCRETIETTSYTLNYDFEDYSSCPNDHSQLSKCDNWIQASNATSDFFNSCDYNQNSEILLPQNGSPSNNGYAGFYNFYKNSTFGNYKEYLGTCLSSTLQAGITYKVKFLLGFGYDYTGKIKSLPNVNISIFGNQNCNSIPFNKNYGNDCPLADGDGFVELVTVNVSGNNEWVEVEAIFTPNIDINAIVVGPDCFQSPFDFSQTYEMEYYYIDKVMIYEENQTSNSFSIIKKGNYCDNDFQFESSIKANESVQWYKDGIALVGEKSEILSIDTTEKGNYQCLITYANGECSKSNKFYINSSSNEICNETNEYGIYIPNSFTPNQDDLNNYFKPVVNNKEILTEYSFEIYNKWGELIFETKEAYKGWAGSYKEINCEQDIYVWKLNYSIRGTAERIQKIGYVSLLK